MAKAYFNFFELQLDYLAFNYNLQDYRKIVTICRHFGESFNCKSTLMGKDNQRKKIFSPDSPSFELQVIQDHDSYWPGYILAFQGENAQKFYQKFMTYQKELDPNLFDLNFVSVGRIDIKYDRRIEPEDPSVVSFLEDSYHRQSGHRSSTFNKQTQMLTIWKRKSSPKFYRVYTKLLKTRSYLRFEIELKKDKAKQYQHLFFQKNRHQFEEGLTSIFFQESARVFNINNPYLDWLLVNFRKLNFSLGQEQLGVSYLQKDFFSSDSEILDIYRFLQLTMFLQKLKYQTSTVGYGQVVIRNFAFPISDFLEYIGEDKKKSYQRQKLRSFFYSLKDIPYFIEKFTDSDFRASATFVLIDFQKRGRSSYVILSVNEKLLTYFYPFKLSSIFLKPDNLMTIKANFFLMHSLCQISTRKEIHTEKFLQPYSSNKYSSTKLKQHLTLLFQELQETNLIQSKFEVIGKNGKLKVVESLTSNTISRSKSIIFYEQI